MNALSNIPTHGLTSLIIDNERLLRALVDFEAYPNKTALAEAAGRDLSNMNRALKALETAGLIRSAAAFPAILTGDGLAALDALDRAAGTPVGTDATFRHDQIEPDPENRAIDETNPKEAAELDDMAATIIAGGIEVPLLITPPAEPGGKPPIFDGERRWRAVGRAITAGKLPADFPIPVHWREPLTRRQRIKRALVVDAHHTDWHPLERGRKYQMLMQPDDDGPGMTKQEIADDIGRSLRHVEQMLDLTEKATDEVKARMRLPSDDDNYLGTKAALQLLATHKPKPALPDMTPDLNLALAEISFACATRRAPEPQMGPEGWTSLGVLGSPLISDLKKRGYIETWTRHTPDIAPSQPGWARPVPSFLQSEDYERWLAAIWQGGGGWPEVITRLRGEIIGPLEAAGMVKDGTFWLKNLNPNNPALIYEGTLYGNATQAAEARARAEGRPAAGSPARTASSSEPAASDRPPQNATPQPMFNDSFAQQMKAVRAEDQGDGAGSLDPSADWKPLPELSPKERLAFIELAHKMDMEAVAVEGLQYAFAQTGDYFRDETASGLQQTHGVVAFLSRTDLGKLARITDKGDDLLLSYGLGRQRTDGCALRVRDEELAKEYAAAGVKPPEKGYAAPWINRGRAAAKAETVSDPRADWAKTPDDFPPVTNRLAQLLYRIARDHITDGHQMRALLAETNLEPADYENAPLGHWAMMYAEKFVAGE